jgi:hypothetical protein
MISTKDFSALHDRHKLYQICKSISVLDAVFDEEWLNRYFSFNSKWAEKEECFEMRNGQGDQILILFQSDGCVINGMVHEYYPKNKQEIVKGLPANYDEFIFGEPIRSIGTTFCLWTENSNWNIGNVTDFNDGSSNTLSIFDGIPSTYFNWATEYFETEFENSQAALNVVTQIYKGNALTKEMIFTLNKEFDHWEQLREDLEEINYPSALE